MDPSYFPASSCMDFMDHEQDETLVPSDFTGGLCIARFQPLNPGCKTPTYFQDKSSDVDDDGDLDGNESNEDESEDAISDSSSSKNGLGNLSSKTDESSTNSSSRYFHPERNSIDHNLIEDQYGSDKGLRSKKTAKEQHCSEIQERQFNKSNVFKLQFHVHNDERPYVCYICNRSFNQREHLEFHIDKHTKIKLYCEICGQRFMKAEQLTKHLQIHSGENTYKCQLCSKGFLNSSGLYSHLRSHYLINPISCAACKKTFARRQNLKSHLIKAHNLSEEMAASILPQKRKAYEHQQKTSTTMISNKIHEMFVPPRHLNSPTSSTKYKATDPCIGDVGHCSNLNSMGVNSVADSPHLIKADQTRSLGVEINIIDKINELKAENSGDHKTIKTSQFPSPITSENPRKFIVECVDDNVRHPDFSKISDSNGEEWINDEICSVSKDTDSISESDLESGTPLPKQPPYPCCYCERQFSRRSNLKVHVKIHLGVKPFPCPTCKKDFNRKSNLKVHMAKVHDCDKNAVIEHLKTYCTNGENNAVVGTELDGIDSIDEAMSALIRDVADNEEQGKHLLGDERADSLNDDNLLFNTAPGHNVSVSYESQSNINQTNENAYLHNSDHYLPLYPTEDNSTYHTNSTADTFKKNIFLTANNNANLPPYNAQNTFQNEHSSELNTSLIKDEKIYKEFSLTFHSQMLSKVVENQNEITSDLKDSFTNDSISKTYECKICGHKFSRRGNLLGHYKVHSGIRQFACPICQKSFTRKSNLRVHLLKIHNMNVEKSALLLELGKQTN
ncbi:hypothetical protein ACJMK2_012742 [Sinanodonta woodiana]|uniref:C2H2-type domain-containing protein n=1 Tax=Sinanodonta woodiana TaxID=1069815 RepID=A0ABD3VAD9_SINWO